MKKRLILLFILLTPFSLKAESLSQMIHFLIEIQRSSLHLEQYNKQELMQLNEIYKGLSGTHSYGKLDHLKNIDTWGNGANTWQELLALSRQKKSGALGDIINRLSNDFPGDDSLGSASKRENKYYELQYQTTLASRAASELAYQHAVKKEETLQTLANEIDKAKDEKSASDLNNRFASEQVNTSLQETKLLSILVQEAALLQEEKANRAKEDMAFFNIRSK